MQSLARRRLSKVLLLARFSPISTLIQGSANPLKNRAPNGALLRGTLSSPWSAISSRSKFVGADVRTGNVIERNGRFYQVIKAQHTQQGRGRASIQVELRDIDTGNKSTSRFRTDEVVDRVFVEEKSYKFLYHDGDIVVLMEPNTFDQVEVSKELFGKDFVYLKEDLIVTLQCYDGKVMSTSIPPKVTCTVVEARPNTKGLQAAPTYKKVKLDNGLTVLAPPHVEPGDEIIVNTAEDTYVSRAK